MLLFLEGLQLQNVLIMFLFSMKHSYLATAKTTQDVNNSLSFLHGIKEILLAILCMSEANFGVSIWPQLSWCSMYMSRHYFVSRICEKYQSSLFSFSVWTALTQCTKLAIIYYQVSASLLLERMFLLKKFISKLITNGKC